MTDKSESELSPEELLLIQNFGFRQQDKLVQRSLWELKDFQSEFEAGIGFLFLWQGPLLNQKSETQGFVMGRVILDEEVWIMNLAVKEKGRGWGKELFKDFLSWAQGKYPRLATIGLEVSVINSPAIALYRTLGFREVSRRKAYYKDGSDALVLLKITGSLW